VYLLQIIVALIYEYTYIHIGIYICIYIGSSVCLLQIVLALSYPAFQEKPPNEKELELEIVERYVLYIYILELCIHI
jgi:uncharacterized membrane protein